MSFMGADVPVLTIERTRDQHYVVTVSSKNSGWPMANSLVLDGSQAARALRELADRIDPDTETP